MKAYGMYLKFVSSVMLCCYIALPATAQTQPSSTLDGSSRFANALAKHKTKLAALFTHQGAEENSSDQTRNPIQNSQFYSPVELFTDGKSLTGSGGYYVSGKDGRDLEISEWFLGARVDKKFGLWVGTQTIAAKGRTRVPRRTSFNASVARFGLRYQITGTEAKGLNVQYDGYHSGKGHAIYSTSEATFAGPKTDVLTFTYTLPSTQEFSEEPELPGKRLRFNIANVQGSGAGSTSFGLGGGVTFKVARKLYGDADLLGLLENRRGGPGGSTLKLQASGGLTYQPVHWAKLQMGLDLFPAGIPLGGSALSGLSAFGVNQISDGVSGFSNGLVAVLNFRLEVGYRF